MAVGTALAIWGTRMGIGGFRKALHHNGLANLATWIQGFRFLIIGLAVVGLGGAWAWHLLWLLVLSLAIGGEEVLESSIVIFALRRGQQLEPAPVLAD